MTSVASVRPDTNHKGTMEHINSNHSSSSSSTGNGYSNGHHHPQQQQQQPKPKPPSLLKSEHLKKLVEPPATAMVLIASIHLLTAPLVPPHKVYLMTQQYLQNWINWAINQPVSSVHEKERLNEVLRLAAVRLRLACPTSETQFANPGPINANELSMQGHPLILRPDATVIATQEHQAGAAAAAAAAATEDDAVPASLRRAKSLPNTTRYLDAALAGTDGETNLEFRCYAVPEQFYEVSNLFICYAVVVQTDFVFGLPPSYTHHNN